MHSWKGRGWQHERVVSINASFFYSLMKERADRIGSWKMIGFSVAVPLISLLLSASIRYMHRMGWGTLSCRKRLERNKTMYGWHKREMKLILTPISVLMMMIATIFGERRVSDWLTQCSKTGSRLRTKKKGERKVEVAPSLFSPRLLLLHVSLYETFSLPLRPASFNENLSSSASRVRREGKRKYARKHDDAAAVVKASAPTVTERLKKTRKCTKWNVSLFLSCFLSCLLSYFLTDFLSLSPSLSASCFVLRSNCSSQSLLLLWSWKFLQEIACLIFFLSIARLEASPGSLTQRVSLSLN